MSYELTPNTTLTVLSTYAGAAEETKGLNLEDAISLYCEKVSRLVGAPSFSSRNYSAKLTTETKHIVMEGVISKQKVVTFWPSKSSPTKLTYKKSYNLGGTVQNIDTATMSEEDLYEMVIAAVYENCDALFLLKEKCLSPDARFNSAVEQVERKLAIIPQSDQDYWTARQEALTEVLTILKEGS